MAEQSWDANRPSHRLLAAHASCLCLGIALVLWGLTPAVLERVITGQLPHWHSWALGGMSVLLGVTFIGLHRLIRQQMPWALWAAFGLALLLTTLAVVGVLLADGRTPSLFSIVFPAATTVATWLALTELRERLTQQPN